LGTADELKTQIIEVALERAFLVEPLPNDEASFKRRIEASIRVWKKRCCHSLLLLLSFSHLLRRSLERPHKSALVCSGQLCGCENIRSIAGHSAQAAISEERDAFNSLEFNVGVRPGAEEDIHERAIAVNDLRDTASLFSVTRQGRSRVRFFNVHTLGPAKSMEKPRSDAGAASVPTKETSTQRLRTAAAACTVTSCSGPAPLVSSLSAKAATAASPAASQSSRAAAPNEAH